MKVLIDHQIFFQNRYGGISKIFSEVIRRLKEKKIEFDTSVSIEEYTKGILLDPETKLRVNRPPFFSLATLYFWILSTFKFLRLSNPEFLIKRESGILKKSLNRSILKFNAKVNNALSNHDFTVFHPTYFQNYYLSHLRKSKTKMVITVYDCVHELFPEYYGLNNFILKNRKSLCEAADHIICISETTKKDLIKLYPAISKDKISIIYLAGDLSAEPETSVPFANYILFVGNRSDYKNFKVLLDAFALIAQKKDLQLVCAGGGKFRRREKQWISRLGLEAVVHQVNFESESILANFYRKAKVFVYPSLYEGFGIPLLEAMSVGCPVLCSSIEVFREVAGNAAMYFDPKDHFDLQTKLLALLNSDTKRKELIENGYIRKKKFSWNQCTDEHIQIYQSLSHQQ
ncbi:glycosyltransferase family 4 protein [Leptospira sp. 201903074]|uniref:glycosyltransferase family 4 protein n=1 Tax=Leptospira abararensis TaxID=2810036 RepID=UPI0019633095|nr:glycosyltransferase family 1 protein [Leptospira abararensis]MBM9547014.1 glycosyltransferase family 4 protein [Leptospira abararensis]